MTAPRNTRPRPLLRYLTILCCAALVTLYVASQRWNFFVQVPFCAVEIMGGVLDVHRGGTASCSVTSHNWPWRHAYAADSGAGYWGIKFPLYVPLIPAIVLTAAFWTRRPGPQARRARASTAGRPVNAGH